MIMMVAFKEARRGAAMLIYVPLAHQSPLHRVKRKEALNVIKRSPFYNMKAKPQVLQVGNASWVDLAANAIEQTASLFAEDGRTS